MSSIFVNSGLIILIYFTLWYITALIIRRNDIVDIAWGGGFILLCIYYLLFFQISSRLILLSTLTIIWGVRLGIFVYKRNKRKEEDFRYLNWRKTWKYFYIRSYFQIFLLQGTLLLIIFFPVSFSISKEQSPFNIIDVFGAIIWITGFLFETVGDAQLSRFKRDNKNKGRIMSTGLWKYTRHPNYFGEVILWWGIFIITLSSPLGYLGIIGPIAITCLILFVSGIPMLEEKYNSNPDFQEYKRKTSAFFPFPPKR